MSLPRRLELLEWARRSGALIFEDDYDSEYRYRAGPCRRFQGLDGHGVVLFAGSFSKVLFPSLRLGYLVVPADLVDRFAAAKSVTSRHRAAARAGGALRFHRRRPLRRATSGGCARSTPSGATPARGRADRLGGLAGVSTASRRAFRRRAGS